MKRLIAILLIAVILCSLTAITSFAAPTNTSATNAILVANEEVADSLPDKKSVRWYKFENKTKGDVVVFLKNTDNIQNIWGVSLFDSTAEREIGYYRTLTGTEYNISYEALDAGTYYLRFIIGSTYQNESYDNLNYTIRIRTVADVNIAPADGKPHVYTKAGEAMFVIDNRVFTKRNDGTTVVAKGYDYNGEPYIVLMGLTEADLKYDLSSNDYTILDRDGTFEYDDENKYYYHIIMLSSRELKTDLYVCNGGERTQYEEDNAYELMNLYMGKEANAGKESLWRKFQKDYGPLLKIALAVGGFVVLGVIVVAIKALIERISYGKSPRSSVSTSTVRDDDIIIKRTQKEIDEMDDMEIAKQIINNIGGTDGI